MEISVPEATCSTHDIQRYRTSFHCWRFHEGEFDHFYIEGFFNYLRAGLSYMLLCCLLMLYTGILFDEEMSFRNTISICFLSSYLGPDCF